MYTEIVCRFLLLSKVNNKKKRKKTKTIQVSSNGGSVKESNPNDELLSSH